MQKLAKNVIKVRHLLRPFVYNLSRNDKALVKLYWISKKHVRTFR